MTIAVEAANETLRERVNKPLKDNDLFAAVESAYRSGWQKLKLYFMVGLPGETLEDVKAIVDLADRLARLRRDIDGKTGTINAAVSWFVPKPHTPLCWLGQRARDYFEQGRALILEEKQRRRIKYIRFKFHAIDQSLLESALGRGNRRYGDVIETAWRHGARFDLWDEHFNYSLWQEAFISTGLELEIAAQRRFAPNELLPWDHLGGPDKAYLLSHYEQVTLSEPQATPEPL